MTTIKKLPTPLPSLLTAALGHSTNSFHHNTPTAPLQNTLLLYTPPLHSHLVLRRYSSSRHPSVTTAPLILTPLSSSHSLCPPCYTSGVDESSLDILASFVHKLLAHYRQVDVAMKR
ncbi:hypothetical protein E2C01_076069 [Portunus trituberculatus]|uniref:Uncharacterized protein n=1 Tax=Portunus trituberculatus TaxID=210409 RepID=A0A5B7IC99_PORTR|nr:hypothetical protein [Portunus trituberculatus]